MDKAVSGARALARDIAGLLAGHAARPTQVTLVGHSYGSLVAAVTVDRLPGAVDDLVVIGSPGLGVGRARDLRLPPGHVWVGAASADEVSHTSWFGPDPAGAAFGAFRFPAEQPPGSSLADQHTRYLDPGSDALAAVGAIVAGLGPAVVRVPGRTDHGFAGEGVRRLLLGPFAGPPDLTLGDPAAGVHARPALPPASSRRRPSSGRAWPRAGRWSGQAAT
jgi:pimeloyl-ACP methyl ester carboxylesterase